MPWPNEFFRWHGDVLESGPFGAGWEGKIENSFDDEARFEAGGSSAPAEQTWIDEEVEMHFEVSDLMVTVLPVHPALASEQCPTQTTSSYEDEQCPTQTTSPSPYEDDDCPTQTTSPDDQSDDDDQGDGDDGDGDDRDDDDDRGGDSCPTVTLVQTSDCVGEAKTLEASADTGLEAHLQALRSRLAQPGSEDEGVDRTGAPS